MGNYTEQHTIILRMLVRDLRTGKYHYLRIIEIDSPLRGFQEKYPYIVEEHRSFLFFIRWWKVLHVDHFFNFTEAREHFHTMIEKGLGLDDTTKQFVAVMAMDLNPDLAWR